MQARYSIRFSLVKREHPFTIDARFRRGLCFGEMRWEELQMPPVLLNGEDLTLRDLERVARHDETVAMDPAARPKVTSARRVIEDGLAAGRPIYGVSTGFGPLSDVFVGAADREALQRNLLRSHAMGVGDPIGEAETRATVLLRANVLAKGHSGVRPEIIDLLCELLNRGVHPIIPERGSVGASGDLAPLAHLALVLIGEGEARYRHDRLPGAEALRRAAQGCVGGLWALSWINRV